MPDAFYLDSETFQKATADVWERSTHTALADRWAAQATAQAPDQLAQAQQQAQDEADAQNQANAERWAQDAAAKYAAVNPPQSPQDAAQPASPTEPPPPAPTDQQAATVAPPTAIPMAPVPMGLMDTAAPAGPSAPVNPTAPVTAPLQAPAGDLEQTVRQAAARHGIDPDTAVRVAQSEGGLSNAAIPGDQGSSFGPFQLHYGNVAQGGNAVAGLGDEFTRQTGLDARDPANVTQAIDFALQHAAQNGWGAFHGAARAGIAAMQGIGQAVSNAGQAVATAIKDPSTILDAVKPFLGQPYVWGGKGPQQGFDCSGLAGFLTTGQPESTTTLYGKSATVNQDQAQPGDLVFWNMGSSDPHQQHVAVYLGNGKIVQSGGNQAAVNIGDVNQSIGSPPEFRRVGPGGTPAQAAAPPGAPSPADNPTYADVMQPADSTSPAQPQASVWEKLGTGISDVFKNLFGGGPAPQTGIPAVDALTGGINLTDPTRSAVGNNPVAPAAGVPTTGQLAQSALANVGQSPVGRFKAEYFPSILDPNHPVNVLSDPNATDEQKQNALLTVVSGVEGGGLGTDAGKALGAEVRNPFALHTDPAPNRVPLSTDEAVGHLQDLEAQYTRNDAQIQTLENQLSSGTLSQSRRVDVGGVVRPPWAGPPGLPTTWTDAGLTEYARSIGANPYQPDWWPGGAGEAAKAAESGFKRLGAATSTPSQIRAQLDQLYTEQDQIMAATEHATANGNQVLYRESPQVSELPFEGYTPAGATTESAAVPGRTLAASGRTLAPEAPTGPGAAPATGIAATSPRFDLGALSPNLLSGDFDAFGRRIRPSAAGGGGAPPIEPPVAPPAQPGGFPSGRPPSGVDWDAALQSPVNQRVAQSFQAKPPTVADDGLLNRIVRATTNRYEAADRYQEDALRSAGLNTANPPSNLDLSAALRLASDPAAEVRIQQGLGPALQMMGNDPKALQALSTYLVHQNNVDVALATANLSRKFSGGLTYQDSLNELQNMQRNLDPAAWQHLEDAAGRIYTFTDQLRQRMVDSGLISAQTAQDWSQKYPHWVPTRILDYMDEGGGPRVGSKISLADNGVRQYTQEGTDRFREDPLASLIGLARQVEAKAMKNDAANALVELDQLQPQGQRLLQPTQRPVTAGESVMQRINNGTVERYVAPPALASVINGPQITQAPGFVRAWTGFIRSMTTVLSPAFALVRNPSLDIPEYMTRELARSGGNPLVIPHLVAELAKGYADAFQGFRGLTEGTYAGPGAQQYMLGGGGSASEVPRTFAQRGDAVARLAADGINLNSADAVGRVLKDLVTLKPVARTAERTELGPRIASMRLAEQRGATPVRAVLNGRTVTLDFNEGGTLAKTINQFIPFFNAGIQGSAQVVRMYRENPVGATTSAMMMGGLPAVAAEAWNNSDPQRAKDYQDVPDYLKQQGVVIMLPGEAPTDDRGNRRPQFYWINMRGLAPFSNVARNAADRVLQATGNRNVQPDDWAKLGQGLFWAGFPIRANTIGDVPGALTGQGLIPGADVGLQLALNKDIFRGADIVTPRRDQYASEVSKTAAGAITSMARTIDPSWQVHPAQLDFAVQQLLGGVGSAALGAGQVAAGVRRDTAVQSAPVVGGMVKALGVRGDTGQTLQDARSRILTPQAQRVVNDAQLQPPAPVSGTIHYNGRAIPLEQVEQADYQQRYTQYASDLITRYAATLANPQYDQVQRQAVLSRLTSAAQTHATEDVLRSIPRADLAQRIRQEDARRRAGVP